MTTISGVKICPFAFLDLFGHTLKTLITSKTSSRVIVSSIRHIRRLENSPEPFFKCAKSLHLLGCFINQSISCKYTKLFFLSNKTQKKGCHNVSAQQSFQFDYQQPEVARSSRFIIEKMNTAESRQSTTSTPHTIQSGIPVPQMRAMTLVR